MAEFWYDFKNLENTRKTCPKKEFLAFPRFPGLLKIMDMKPPGQVRSLQPSRPYKRRCLGKMLAGPLFPARRLGLLHAREIRGLDRQLLVLSYFFLLAQLFTACTRIWGECFLRGRLVQVGLSEVFCFWWVLIGSMFDYLFATNENRWKVQQAFKHLIRNFNGIFYQLFST